MEFCEECVDRMQLTKKKKKKGKKRKKLIFIILLKISLWMWEIFQLGKNKDLDAKASHYFFKPCNLKMYIWMSYSIVDWRF